MKPYYNYDGITIYHGDFREALREVPDASADMIWTDPPYGHANLQGDLAAARVGVKGGRKRAAKAIANDQQQDWEPLMHSFLEEADRVLKPDCCCCCCTGGGGPSPSFARLALWIDQKLEFFHAVVWDKSDRGNGLGWRYRRNYEFVMVAHKKGGRLSWSDEGRAVPNILRIRPEPNDVHPTKKPLALVSRFIEWHTKPGDLVIDPFMGSGGIEIDERYCEVAAKRMAQEVLEFA